MSGWVVRMPGNRLRWYDGSGSVWHGVPGLFVHASDPWAGSRGRRGTRHLGHATVLGRLRACVIARGVGGTAMRLAHAENLERTLVTWPEIFADSGQR